MERLQALTYELKRNTFSLTQSAELPRKNYVLATDIEGPLFLGDFIAEAMDARLGPKNRTENSPRYGQIMYQETWDWFTQETVPSRRGNGHVPRDAMSTSQEGTDTIFTLPLLLAENSNMAYLEELTLNSQTTPGADILIKELSRDGINTFGITTAPQEPYRKLVAQRKFVDPRQVIGSPFPIEDARMILQQTGRWDIEITIVRNYLEESYQIIDTFAQERVGLSPEGREVLRKRIKLFHENEIGISYDPQFKKRRGVPPTILGQIIESTGMVGDRAKAAIAKTALITSGTRVATLITMGDGANDAVMLKEAPISIGLNGADAARAAKIAVVTDDMKNLLPLFEIILSGEKDIDSIVAQTRIKAGSHAIVTRGGDGISTDIINEHRKMKRTLRGQNVTY